MLSNNPRPRKGTLQQAPQPQLSYVQRVPVGGIRNAAVHYSTPNDYQSQFSSLEINGSKPTSAPLPYRHIQQSAYIKQQPVYHHQEKYQQPHQLYSPANTQASAPNYTPATPTSLSSSGSNSRQQTPHPPFSPESIYQLPSNNH
jgi:hypothetical protein